MLKVCTKGRDVDAEGSEWLGRRQSKLEPWAAHLFLLAHRWLRGYLAAFERRKVGELPGAIWENYLDGQGG